MRILFLDDCRGVRSIHTGHAYIHDDKVDRHLLYMFETFLTIGDAAGYFNHVVVGQERNEGFFEKIVIVDDQSPYFVHPYSLRSVGKVHRIVVPLPSLLLTSRDPLISRARSCIESNP